MSASTPGKPTRARERTPDGKGPGRVRGTAYRGLQDGQLVQLVAEKDADALEILYERYGKVAYSLARRILTDEVLAQDVVQAGRRPGGVPFAVA
jgi:hypothetical protein